MKKKTTKKKTMKKKREKKKRADPHVRRAAPSPCDE
jgi:hypothetical protein